MASKISAEIIRTIVGQRSQLAGESTQQFLDSATQQAEHILSYGLNIAIRISLVALKCQCSQKEECQKSMEFEVWNIQLEKNSINNSILPVFLQNAVLSQLHFSPFNAWLSDSDRFPSGYRCIYR
jgi:hypothetical protein